MVAIPATREYFNTVATSPTGSRTSARLGTFLGGNESRGRWEVFHIKPRSSHLPV